MVNKELYKVLNDNLTISNINENNLNNNNLNPNNYINQDNIINDNNKENSDIILKSNNIKNKNVNIESYKNNTLNNNENNNKSNCEENDENNSNSLPIFNIMKNPLNSNNIKLEYKYIQNNLSNNLNEGFGIQKWLDGRIFKGYLEIIKQTDWAFSKIMKKIHILEIL